MFDINFNNKKRRGRPCASERLEAALSDRRLTNLIQSNPNDELTKQCIRPLLIKRERRQRANGRERSRARQISSNTTKFKHIITELNNYQVFISIL
jgi:hypothetical protein